MPETQPTQQQDKVQLHPIFERFMKELPDQVKFDEQNNRVMFTETQHHFMPSGEFVAPEGMSFQEAFDIANQYHTIFNNDTIPQNRRSSNTFWVGGSQRHLPVAGAGAGAAERIQGVEQGGQYENMNQTKVTAEGNLLDRPVPEERQSSGERTVPLSRWQAGGVLAGTAAATAGGAYGLYKSGIAPWSLYQAETALTHMSPRKWAQWGKAFPEAKGMLRPQSYNLAIDPSKNYSGNVLFKGLENRRGTNLQNYLQQKFPGADLSQAGSAPITDKHGFLKYRFKGKNIPGAERFIEATPKPPAAATTTAAPAAAPKAVTPQAAPPPAATPPTRQSVITPAREMAGGRSSSPAYASGTGADAIPKPVAQTATPAPGQTAVRVSSTNAPFRTPQQGSLVSPSGMSLSETAAAKPGVTPSVVSPLRKTGGSMPTHQAVRQASGRSAFRNAPRTAAPALFGINILTDIIGHSQETEKMRSLSDSDIANIWNDVQSESEMNPNNTEYQGYKTIVERELERRGLKKKGQKVGPLI